MGLMQIKISSTGSAIDKSGADPLSASPRLRVRSLNINDCSVRLPFWGCKVSDDDGGEGSES